MKTLYITDLDGTFLNSKAELSANSERIISQAIKSGANFSIATARTFATVNKMFRSVDLKIPIVLMNGVMIYEPSNKKIILCHSIDNYSIAKVFEIYLKHNIYPLVYRYKEDYLEIEYYSTDNPYQMKYVGKRTDAAGKRFIYSESFTTEDKSEVIYIVTLDKYETLLPLYNDIKELKGISCVFYRDNYTDCYFLEIFAENVSKASSLLEVKRLIGAEKVICFGDNLNDIEMFTVADEAYAVENACSEVKKMADSVIGSNDEDSVAKFILDHFSENYK